MSTVRLAPINESLGEPELDANSALTELDKGKYFMDVLEHFFW